MDADTILKCCDHVENVAVLLGAAHAVPEIAHHGRAMAAPVVRVVRVQIVWITAIVVRRRT